MGRDQSRTSGILEAVALVVVDMQEPFLNAIEGSTSVALRCAFAIETARAFGIRVVFTEQVPEKLGRTHPSLRALAPEVRAFPKTAFSALQAEGIVEHLRNTGTYHLLVAGLETSVCVYQTALHAQDSDFDVTVLSDCVTGRRTDDSRVVLQALTGASCHVLPSETVFYSMLGTSEHPLFSAFTSLVKKYGSPDLTLESAAATRLRLPDRPPELIRAAEPQRRPSEPDEVEPDAPDDEIEDDVPDAEEIDSGDDEPGDTVPMDGPQKKRSRRRRGGARRRRARERAAGEAPPQGSVASGGTEQNNAPRNAASDGDGPAGQRQE